MESGRLPTHTDNVDQVAAKFFQNASHTRINTNVFIYNAICTQHPGVEVVDVREDNVDVLAYLRTTSDGEVTKLTEDQLWPSKLRTVHYFPPASRVNGSDGVITEIAVFDKFLITWRNTELLIYVVEGRNGENYPGYERRHYILGDKPTAYLLLKSAGSWGSRLHDEIWIFDSGYWQKDARLYQNIMNSSWEDVILEKEFKDDLLHTVTNFFNSQETYRKLRVPWKRGLIFYGPPGNGKTISIKATMHTLYDRKPEIPTLYVKSFKNVYGPEYAIAQIFIKAREEAPCYLVFEDLDSMVSDDVRSYFLNAVDGLAENDGVLMVGSTNHLERLDPGIAKRPSRFDRKYLFEDPGYEQRVQYCQFWQRKLKDNKDVQFPDKLCPEIAKITDKFSFAYMQEAFVATLLDIANSKDGKRDGSHDLGGAWDIVDLTISDSTDSGDQERLDKYLLWRKIQVQIKYLRKELDDGAESRRS